MLNSSFILEVKKNAILLKADPDTINDMAILLDSLVSITKQLHHKAYLASIKEQKAAVKRQKKGDQNNKEIARAIYKRYNEHLNNGCHGDKTKARKLTAGDFRILNVDAKHYISQGKKLLKNKPLQPSAKPPCNIFFTAARE